MGYTPEEVNRMSLWEYLCCRAGYAQAHGGEKPGAAGISPDDIDDARLRAMGIAGF